MNREGLYALVSANAPLWAAEAEIVRTYWDSPLRTRETDLRWLMRQCYKEYWDGFVPPFERLREQIHDIDRRVDRRTVLEHAHTLAEELAHYCAFADVYDAVRRDDEPGLDPDTLKSEGNWPENVALAELRAAHRRHHGEIGRRAYAFTEGGYCTLYAEGMRLRGRGGIDERIADACGRVHEDEFAHMLLGIAGLDEQPFDAAEWDLLRELCVEQMKLRIEMRNAQFGHPVSPGRVAAMQAGACEPLAFDWERAGLEPPPS